MKQLSMFHRNDMARHFVHSSDDEHDMTIIMIQWVQFCCNTKTQGQTTSQTPKK